MENKLTAAKFGTRQIVVVGILSAVSIILGIFGIGFIPLPIAKATIMHIPVIIGSIVEGPVVGALVGLMFGLFSLYQNYTFPTLLSFAFQNPLVSVLPRILIGLTPYLCYRLIKSRNEKVKIGVGAAVGSLTNTFGVLGTIMLLYARSYAEKTNNTMGELPKYLGGVILTNGIPEAIIAVIITIPVVLAVKKFVKA